MVPFQAIFGIRLYLSTEGTERGGEKLKKPSNWEDCSTNGSMNNSNIKQGSGVCPAPRETWQAKDAALQFFTKGLQTRSQNKDSTKSLCIWQMENKAFVLFWGYGWERVENISAEKAQKHLPNFERNENVIRELFLFPPAVPAERKGAAERMHETVV